uniref:Uncharacterized protein n=1 Tax=Arion vulgaris TaxID=1028688 RepID=A0A0B6Z8I5_9EUPU
MSTLHCNVWEYAYSYNTSYYNKQIIEKCDLMWAHKIKKLITTYGQFDKSNCCGCDNVVVSMWFLHQFSINVVTTESRLFNTDHLIKHLVTHHKIKQLYNFQKLSYHTKLYICSR